MRRTPVTFEDIIRWKAQGLGPGEGTHYKPWIDVRCFSSRGRMSRRVGVTTCRVHHLFSDNESSFFLLADHAANVVDIREQFRLMPESATENIARSLGIRHPRYPRSNTPIVMSTDFLLTLTNKDGEHSFMACCIKSADELCGRSRKTVLGKLEIERRYWCARGIPWYLSAIDSSALWMSSLRSKRIRNLPKPANQECVRSTTQRCRPKRSLLSIPLWAMRCNAAFSQITPASSIVVALVGMQFARALSRPPIQSRHGRNSVQGAFECYRIVSVCPCDRDCQRNAPRVDNDVPFAA